jgi:hypothetical protein
MSLCPGPANGETFFEGAAVLSHDDSHTLSLHSWVIAEHRVPVR